jgi:hypothetical protein
LEEHGDTRDRAALEIHDLLPTTDRPAMLSHNQRCISGVKKGRRRGNRQILYVAFLLSPH